jgi:hypothetical protein
MPKKLLYITWDGPQVSYLEGLFFPILNGLKAEYEIHVIQFSWGDQRKSDKVNALLHSAGIIYKRVNVGPRAIVPLGILLTLLRGVGVLRKYIHRQGIKSVLFRSTYPGLMMLLLRKRDCDWIFDTDGLPIDEKVDLGAIKPGGMAFRLMKWAESRIIKRSDRVLVRSMKALYALPVMKDKDMYKVVTNGRDPGLYRYSEASRRQELRRELGLSESDLVLVYAGSLGHQYSVPEMIELTRSINQRRPTKLLMLTGSPEFLETLPIAGEDKALMIIRDLSATEVPDYLGCADMALAIRRAYPSMKAVLPLKLGEYLLTGLPVVASKGIGDTEAMMTGAEGCLLLPDHSTESLLKAADWVCGIAGRADIRSKNRKLGLAYFGLEESILTYKRALASSHA